MDGATSGLVVDSFTTSLIRRLHRSSIRRLTSSMRSAPMLRVNSSSRSSTRTTDTVRGPVAGDELRPDGRRPRHGTRLPRRRVCQRDHRRVHRGRNCRPDEDHCSPRRAVWQFAIDSGSGSLYVLAGDLRRRRRQRSLALYRVDEASGAGSIRVSRSLRASPDSPPTPRQVASVSSPTIRRAASTRSRTAPCATGDVVAAHGDLHVARGRRDLHRPPADRDRLQLHWTTEGSRSGRSVPSGRTADPRPGPTGPNQLIDTSAPASRTPDCHRR